MSRRSPRSRRFPAAAGVDRIDLSSLSFSRSSEGSYLTAAPGTGASAFLAWATSNAARWENRGDGGGALLLIEGARTNQLVRSQELNDAAWAGPATVTAGQVGPDGTTAERVEVGSGTNGLTQNITPGSGWRAISAWVRATTGTKDHSVYLFDGASVTYVAQASISTTYTRLAGSMNCGAGAGNFSAVDGRTGGGISAGARDAYVTLVQVEAGRYASSAIRTAGATATRSADTATATSGSYPSSLLTTPWRFTQLSPIFSDTELASGDERWLLSLGGSSNGIRIRHDGTDVRVEAVQSGIVRARSGALTFSRHALLGPIVWSPTAATVSVNGVSGAVGTTWTWSAAALRVGGIHGGASEADARFGSLEAV